MRNRLFLGRGCGGETGVDDLQRSRRIGAWLLASSGSLWSEGVFLCVLHNRAPPFWIFPFVGMVKNAANGVLFARIPIVLICTRESFLHPGWWDWHFEHFPSS